MKVAIGRTDVELLLVVLLWAFNLTVVKVALREMEPLAFNMVRFACAGILLLALTLALEGSIRVRREDWLRIALLGAVGHTLYQIAFVHGLALTTASSTALIFGTTPVVVAILSRIAGHERVGLASAAGAALAFYGVYLIAARGGGEPPSANPGAKVVGDLLVMGAVLCWSFYTVMSRDLLERYSPLRITTVTLLIGAALMAPAAAPELARQRWGSIGWLTWAGLGYSFVFALALSYVLWYRSVQRVGNLRTAVYSNLVPVFGTAFGIALLGERITAGLAVGAACILAGIVLTRMAGVLARAGREVRSTSP